MIRFFVRAFGRVLGAVALAFLAPLLICSPSTAQTLKCVEVVSSGSKSCTDPGGVDSTCSSAKCPAELTLTGAGGACAAGDRKIKSLLPRVDDGSVTIMCEKQGVDPQAIAVCCQLQK
jgi:hypothetical protein